MSLSSMSTARAESGRFPRFRPWGGKSSSVHCDCSDPASIAAAFSSAYDEFHTIQILLSGPAGNTRSHPEEMKLEDWRRCLDLGVTSTLLCAQEAGRRMIAQGHGGSIINLPSIAGSNAMGRGSLGYSASKGAINQLTKELAIEWGARYSIRVNAIQPCQIHTPGLDAMIADDSYLSKQLVTEFMRGIPMSRVGEPEDIASAAVFLASDAASLVTGILLAVDGGNLAMNAGGTLQW